MLRKVIALVMLVALAAMSFGCTTSYSGLSPTSHVRRYMIAGEQLKLIQQDSDRLLGVEDYPTFGRWQH